MVHQVSEGKTARDAADAVEALSKRGTAVSVTTEKAATAVPAKTGAVSPHVTFNAVVSAWFKSKIAGN